MNETIIKDLGLKSSEIDLLKEAIDRIDSGRMPDKEQEEVWNRYNLAIQNSSRKLVSEIKTKISNEVKKFGVSGYDELILYHNYISQQAKESNEDEGEETSYAKYIMKLSISIITILFIMSINIFPEDIDTLDCILSILDKESNFNNSF